MSNEFGEFEVTLTLRWRDATLWQTTASTIMRTLITLSGVLVLTGLLLTIASVGSTAHAQQRVLSGREAAARMDAARSQVANVRSNMLVTLVELDKVRGERDPARPQFAVFTNQLARLEELATAFGIRAEEMRQRGKAYFADWEARTAAIKDPNQRRLAEKRYGQRKASYNSINKSMQEAKKNFVPFVAEIRAIKSLLEAPLGQEEMMMVSNLFMRANWHSIDVQRSLMEIEQEFDRLAKSFGQNQ